MMMLPIDTVIHPAWSMHHLVLHTRAAFTSIAQDYTAAIECYQKFLRLCQHSQDQQGEMLALNAIGVSYQQMGLGTACAGRIEVYGCAQQAQRTCAHG